MHSAKLPVKNKKRLCISCVHSGLRTRFVNLNIAPARIYVSFGPVLRRFFKILKSLLGEVSLRLFFILEKGLLKMNFTITLTSTTKSNFTLSYPNKNYSFKSNSFKRLYFKKLFFKRSSHKN